MNPCHSETLASRTFVGLLLAQFTATFNDQAIHMVAIFFSADMLVRFAHLSWVDEKKIIAIITACFITPFLLFSSYAGPLGDRFSKRSVIVFWKAAEVFMMGLALVGLGLPHFASETLSPPALAIWSSGLVIFTVFLMGMHSTFFVPAKLGAMPEILHPAILSRGNGILEGTSFTAQILGTSAGGILYSLLKVKGEFQPGPEWIIGALLLGLALLGTVTAFLMRPIPAAAPDRRISWSWWRPLQRNLSILRRSKPLMLSVTGIAFCVFMTLFLRQTLLYQGELTKEVRGAKASLARLHHADAGSVEQISPPLDQFMADILPDWLEKAAQESEMRVALLFAVVGLGVGLGSILAGYLSGHRIELGLVPVGALLIVLCTLVAGALRDAPRMFIGTLFGIGCGAGFYLVPLYTLLQHRAPKESKGNVVSASNFLNVVGGIIAVAVFYGMTSASERMLRPALDKHAVFSDPTRLPEYIADLERQLLIPNRLFMLTAVMTFGALIFLRQRRLPDFYLRTAIWIRAWGHNPLRTIGIEHMPTDGPVLLLTNCNAFPAVLDLVAGIDRYSRVVLIEKDQTKRTWLRGLAGPTLVPVPALPGAADWNRALETGTRTLKKGEMVALNINQPDCTADVARLIDAWRAAAPETVVLPVCSTAAVRSPITDDADSRPYPRVIFGQPVSPQASIALIVTAIDLLTAAPEDE
jgi:acyl-[acyl-carrier-protein]-phospholipid O-acyltransferase/long-chain-fatty-acid--[acyl-carrier-protein] ligase